MKLHITIAYILSILSVAYTNADDKKLPPVRSGIEEEKKWRLVFEDDFSGNAVDQSVWYMYHSIGHDGNGLRRPETISVENGLLVITARMKDDQLVSGGMAHRKNYTYGKFEFRVRTEVDPSEATSGVVLTWPQSERWPEDGENDMYETGTGASRNPFHTFIHYDKTNRQYHFAHLADATEWQLMAMEWEPDELRIYRNGELVWTLTDKEAIPQVPHHICLQLDAFKKEMTGEARLYVDWVKIYQRADREPQHTRDWQLVWNDEFNYTGLPDAGKWDYEEGLVRNGEEQYYTKARVENAYVDKGVLTITGRQEQYPNATYVPGSADWKNKDKYASYTSACLTTRGKASWTYGRIEVRARLPQGRGIWPAFWTLGDNVSDVGWPRCGEIDIMEHVGSQSDKVHTNVHYERIADGKYATHMRPAVVEGISSQFHLYAIEWNRERIRFFVDGTEVNVFDTAAGGNTFHRPHYLLLNLALGGSWGGEIDDTLFPQKYEIDYVRVYQ